MVGTRATRPVLDLLHRAERTMRSPTPTSLFLVRLPNLASDSRQHRKRGTAWDDSSTAKAASFAPALEFGHVQTREQKFYTDAERQGPLPWLTPQYMAWPPGPPNFTAALLRAHSVRRTRPVR